MRYLIIFEHTSNGLGAYLPDLPGCVATGDDQDEVRRNIQEAVEFHLEGLRESGVDAPSATSFAEYFDPETDPHP